MLKFSYQFQDIHTEIQLENEPLKKQLITLREQINHYLTGQLIQQNQEEEDEDVEEEIVDSD